MATLEVLRPQQTGAAVEKMPFEELYNQYYTKIFLYIKNKINNIQDAEDLTSEAFIYCYNHYDDYDPTKSALTTWLYLIVNSRLKNYYRDHKEHTDIGALENLLSDDRSDMDRGIYLEQLREVLARAIKTLPEKQQQIVVLRYFKNKDSNEIAEILDMTPGNVRVQLSRALDKMEKQCQFLRV